MLFNSLQYIFFFIIVVSLYFTISHRYRWMFLLTASYYFYMSWRADYLFLIIISTLIRVFIAGTLEFSVDEVYYWTYAMFPDWSHFDHPPMVAFLIYLGHSILQFSFQPNCCEGVTAFDARFVPLG